MARRAGPLSYCTSGTFVLCRRFLRGPLAPQRHRHTRPVGCSTRPLQMRPWIGALPQLRQRSLSSLPLLKLQQQQL